VDDPHTIVDWDDDVQQITPGEPWNPADPVGSRFTQQIREGNRTATYDGEILAHDKPDHLALKLSSAQYTMHIDYRFHAVDAERTRLDYTVEMAMHTLLARIMGRLFAGMTRRLTEQQVAALKAYAERTAS
jgi:hypothetical protein